MIYSENGIWSNHIIRIFCFIFSGIAPTLCSKVLFYYAFGKKLDLKNPQTLDEKLMWLKLNTYKDNPLVAQCIDKYAVRFYIESQGCSELLNDLIGVWKRAEEIPFSELPQKFVLKCNHGCGYNIICRDKSIFDSKAAVKRLKHWLREDFWRRFAEINYKTIPPKIICEAYIDENINRL